MTRKEELEARVEKLASRFERIGESQAKYEIVEALLQVEREVWGKAAMGCAQSTGARMMTRERFLSKMQYIQEFSRGWSEETYRVSMEVQAHDAEQRAELARLRAELQALKESAH